MRAKLRARHAPAVTDRTARARRSASGHWLWGDGSLAAIAHTITVGVPKPKQYGAPMPPMGGAELSPSELSAVAAYDWALGHRTGG
jgi:hypothetical protein